jgi:hypothetical protein
MEKHPCGVCSRLDGDDTEKDCTYCGFCGAWLCEKDKLDMVRRAKAFGQKLAEKIPFSNRRVSGMSVKLR